MINITKSKIAEAVFVNADLKDPYAIELQIRSLEEMRNNFLNYNGKIPKMSISYDATISLIKNIVQEIIIAFSKLGYSMSDLPTSHSRGHMRDDLATVLWLILDFKSHNFKAIDKIHYIIAGVASCFTDLGALFIGRYNEAERIIKHAEAGGIAIAMIIDQCPTMQYIKRSFGEKVANFIKNGIVYCVNAHTHILKTQKVMDHLIEPYEYQWKNGSIMHCLIITRWADATNALGANWFLRNLLAKKEDHYDWNGHEYVLMGIEKALYPFEIPDGKEREYGYTLRQHIVNRALSQRNGSPYCIGYLEGTLMTQLRDYLVSQTMLLITFLDKKPIKTVVSRDQLHEFLLNRITLCGKSGDREIETFLNRFYTEVDTETRQIWLTVITKIIKVIKLHQRTEDEQIAFNMANKILGI